MNHAAVVIKNSLSMAEVAEFYGFHASRAGFIQCPFHAGDHSASLKIYPGKGGGFFCFGCKASGSVIDFVMRLFDCSFLDAAKRLNDDFNLGIYQRTYRDKKAHSEALVAKQRELKRVAEQKADAEEKYWLAFDRWLAADNLRQQSEPMSEAWADAVKLLPQLLHELNLADERRREFDCTS